MRRQLPLLAFVLVAWCAPARASSPEPWVERALRDSPTLDALQQRLDAVQHRTAQAGARPEPMLAVEYGNMPVTAPYPGVHAMSGVQLKLQYTFPFPGTVPGRVAAAQRREAVAAASLDEGQVQLAASVRRAFWELTRVRQLRAVTVAHVVLVDQLIETVRAAYEVGRASQGDLLGLQVLRDRLDDETADFDRAERIWLAALGEAVHHDPAADGPLVVETPADTAVPTPAADLDELVARAAADHPALRGLAAAAEAERAAADAARREAYPDLTLWGGYRVRAPVGTADPGTNFVSLGVSLPLPTSAERRWGREADAHEATARAAEADAAAALDGLRADLDAALAAWQRAADKQARYRGELIPAAERALEATRSSYQVDQAGFADLYRAEVQLLQLQRAARVAAADAALGQAATWALLGAARAPEEGGER